MLSAFTLTETSTESLSVLLTFVSPGGSPIEVRAVFPQKASARPANARGLVECLNFKATAESESSNMAASDPKCLSFPNVSAFLNFSTNKPTAAYANYSDLNHMLVIQSVHKHIRTCRKHINITNVLQPNTHT